MFIASKSTNQGEYKENFECILKNQVNCDKLKEYLKENNCSAIFECIDPHNDPHIIEYGNAKVVLLDIVKNDFSDTFKSYNEVKLLAQFIHCDCKELYVTLDNIDELKSFIDTYNNNFKTELEGFVFVDQNNFMIKYKTPFYKFWKDMRRMKEYIDKGDSDKYFATKNVNSEQTDLMNDLFKFMTELKNNNVTLDALSIIDIRNMYNGKID